MNNLLHYHPNIFPRHLVDLQSTNYLVDLQLHSLRHHHKLKCWTAVMNLRSLVEEMVRLLDGRFLEVLNLFLKRLQFNAYCSSYSRLVTNYLFSDKEAPQTQQIINKSSGREKNTHDIHTHARTQTLGLPFLHTHFRNGHRKVLH